MWKLGQILHAASYLLWMLIGIAVAMFALDGCATFVAGGIDAL
ncbi:hypothetical protein [Sphingopyxis witflariensis]|nr:hypothetical protein [Sphingopyxis witflariensis]